MIFLLLLVTLLTQDAFCKNNITHHYNVGLLYEKREGKEMAALAETQFVDSELHFEGLLVEPNSTYDFLNSACDLILKYPPVGIFGPTSKINVDIIQGLCTAGNIPHILTDYVGPLHGKTQVSVYPSIDLLTNAYIDILTSMEWKQFTYLYCMSEELGTGAKFIQKAQENKFVFNFEFISPDDPGEQRSIVKKLKKSGTKHFVIDCPENDIVKILSLFGDFGMITEEYHYFLASIKSHDPEIYKFASTEADIIQIQLIGSTTVDFADYGNMSLLAADALVSDAIQLFTKSLESVKPIRNVSINCENITRWTDGDDVMNYILSRSHKGVTGEIRFGPDRYRNTLDLFIFKLKETGMEEIATWNKRHGVKYTTSFVERENITSDWRSKPLIVTVSLTTPYVMLVESIHPLYGNDRYKGFAIDVIEELSKMLNFNYTIIVAFPPYFGAFNHLSGQWSGMVGELLEEKADLAIADITITSERINVVDFSLPILYTGISILFQKPTIMPPGFYYFARPFSPDFWRAITVAFVAVTISLFIVGRLCESEWQTPNPKSKYSMNQLTFVNSIWFVAGSLFRQNTQVKISSISGRIIAAAWWLFSFLVIAMYIAGLISHEVKYEKETLFTDLKSLVTNAKEHNIAYGAKQNGATFYFFKSSQNPLHQDVYRHMAENPDDMVNVINEGVERAEKTRYAFFAEETTIDYITNRHCALTKYGGRISENYYGIAMRPNSSFHRDLNVAILKLSNMGKLDELKRKWWGHSDHYCNGQIIEEVAPVFIIDIIGLIHITLIGTSIALMGGIVEFLFYVYRKSKKVKMGFFHVFSQEIRRCFRKNTKPVIDPNLISRPVPEDEMEQTTSDGIELS